MSDPLIIHMQSRPEGFGPCYECADGLHERCLGVPCSCPCEWPKRDAPTPSEIIARLMRNRRAAEAMALAACLGTAAPGEPPPLDALDRILATSRLALEYGQIGDWGEDVAAVERLARELRAALAKAGGEEA